MGMMSSPHAAVASDLSGALGQWCRLLPLLKEPQTRLYVAQQALELGRGGISTVADSLGSRAPPSQKASGSCAQGLRRRPP